MARNRPLQPVGRLIILYRVPCKRFLQVAYARIVLDVNPLDLIERQFLVHAVIELRGTGRFVTGDAGGDFQDHPRCAGTR